MFLNFGNPLGIRDLNKTNLLILLNYHLDIEVLSTILDLQEIKKRLRNLEFMNTPPLERQFN